jgi:hypothetical protein
MHFPEKSTGNGQRTARHGSLIRLIAQRFMPSFSLLIAFH